VKPMDLHEGVTRLEVEHVSVRAVDQSAVNYGPLLSSEYSTEVKA